MSSGLTWRRGSGLIAFTMNVPSASTPGAAMAGWVVALFDHVRLVGHISSASLSTHTSEDAERWSGPVDARKILEDINRREDVAAIMCTCDLVCRNVDGAAFEITSGLMAYIEFSSREQPDPTASLESTLILDTDVYAAVSWGDNRDNRDMSRLNAPSFNRFLQRFASDLSAHTMGVDAADYYGQVNAHGFVVPD